MLVCGRISAFLEGPTRGPTREAHPRGPPEGFTRGAPRPSRGAQVGGPTWGPSQKFGTPKNPKNNISQNQNPFCPKCRQGFFTPEKKASPPPWGPSRAIFYVGRKNQKNVQILPIFLGGPMGPIHPLWGQWALPLAREAVLSVRSEHSIGK